MATNPTLIVSLESRQDKALIALATAPHLAIPGLRTVTLRSALDRVALMHGPLPITSERQQQLIDCRNSSTHVGMIPRSDGETEERFARRVLADSLLLSNFFLDHLDHDTSQFYGQHKSMVAGLLDKQRTETQQQVDRLFANAKTRIDSLREHFDDDELWRSSAQELEAVDPPRLAMLLDSDQLPIEYDCPSCGYRGRLIGAIEVDVTMDFDVSDGESMPVPFFTTFFHARSFLCNVCCGRAAVLVKWTGRPAELPPTPWPPLRTRDRIRIDTDLSRTPHKPSELLDHRARVVDKPVLVRISRFLEQTAIAAPEPLTILASFEHARYFTSVDAARYTALAAVHPLVAIIGIDVPAVPAPGVRGTSIGSDDPLADEWTVVIVGRHFFAALLSRDVHDSDDAVGGSPSVNSHRRFTYSLTYDRAAVTAAGRALLHHMH